MTTKELSIETGIPERTIRKLAPQLDGIPVGGSHGYEFPKDSPQRLRALLRQRRGGSQWRIAQMRKQAAAKIGI